MLNFTSVGAWVRYGIVIPVKCIMPQTGISLVRLIRNLQIVRAMREEF